MRFSPALLLSLMTLGAGGATLATGLDWQPDPGTVAVIPAPAPQPVKTAAAAPSGDAALLQALRDRPPFTPGRRPPQQMVLAVADAPGQAAEAVADLAVPTVRGAATASGWVVSDLRTDRRQPLRRQSAARPRPLTGIGTALRQPLRGRRGRAIRAIRRWHAMLLHAYDTVRMHAGVAQW